MSLIWLTISLILLVVCSVLLLAALSLDAEDECADIYPLDTVEQTSPGQYDVVIPVGPNDADFVHHILPFLFRNVIGIRRVYLVSPSGSTRRTLLDLIDNSSDDLFLVPERRFPFSIRDVKDVGIRRDRAGWYLQQLLKLYAHRAIPALTRNFLVWDADTFLMRPRRFFSESGTVGMFGTGRQNHLSYFNHMKALHPTFRRMTDVSGICNFMPFCADSLNAMMSMVEQHHDGQPFWRVFLQHVNPHELSGASEFEMYFNYMQQYEPDRIRILRHRLVFDNFREVPPDEREVNHPVADIVSCHYYLRRDTAESK